MPFRKKITAGVQRRALGIGDTQVDLDTRTATLSFSSEYPVERYFGNEILDHSTGANVDLSRLNDGAPLLWNHDPGQVIGVVERAWIENNRGMAQVRFSQNPQAQQVMQDVNDRILRNVSFGYQANRYVADTRDANGDVDSYRVPDWSAFEISMVGIPADPTVGWGRAPDIQAREIQVEGLAPEHVPVTPAQTTRTQIMTPEEIAAAAAAKENADAERQAAIAAASIDVRNAIIGITAMGERFQLRELAQDLIKNGASLDAARAAFMDKIAERQQTPVAGAPSAQNLGVTNPEIRKYSLIKAIRAQASGNWQDAGFERELSAAIAKRSGKDSNGFFVPLDLPMDSGKRVFEASVPTQGGNLVANNLLAGSFIDLLRNKALVTQLGATFLSGLVGNVTIPRQNAAGQTYWVAENAAITESEGAFDSIALSPHTVAARSQMTRQMLQQSTPDIEMLARNDLILIMALALDSAAIYGTGTNGQPLGILNQTGIGSEAIGTNGGAISIDNLIDMETLVASANADMGALAYLTNPHLIGSLKKLKSTTGQYLWTDNPIGMRTATPGEINGYPVARTNQIQSNGTKGTGTNLSSIIYGNWNDLIIGEWGVLEILANPFGAGYNSGAVDIRAMQTIDLNVRHVASFSACTDAQ